MSASASTHEAEIVLNGHLGYFRHLVEQGGGTVHDVEGVVVFEPTHGFPVFGEAVVRATPVVPPSRVFGIGVEVLGPERGFEVGVVPGRDDDLAAEAEARGLTVGGGAALQILEAGGLLGTRDHVDVREVVDETGVSEITAITEDAHRVYGFPAGLFPALFAKPETVLSPDIHAVVAHEGDAPVATAQVHLTGDVGYIAWVATVESARRRGLGATLTHVVTNVAFDRGATRCVLVASPMGAPIYRRMGYRDVGTFQGTRVPAGR